MPTFAFIDTNIVLHYQFFRDIDWTIELGVTDVTLVLAPVVLGELDQQKWSGSRREKQRASKFLKALKDLGLSTQPVHVRPRVTIMALDDEPDDAELAKYRLNARSADDRLLGSLLAFKATRSADDRIVLLTSDTGLSIKAPTRHVKAVALDDRLRMADEPDETERALEIARRELAETRSAEPNLRLAFATGSHLELSIQLASTFDEDTLKGLMAAWRARHPRATSTATEVGMPIGGLFQTPNLGFPGYVSEEDADESNREIDGLASAYENYLAEWPSIVNDCRRCIEINLVLENQGTGPADDVDLMLWTLANGVWREELPEPVEPPAMPRQRDRHDFALNAHLPAIDMSSLRMPDAPIDGPNIPEDDPTQARYVIKRVKHHVPCELPKVYFQFATDSDVSSFSINYRLVAANIRQPREHSLHIKLSQEAAGAPPTPEQVFGG